MLDKDEGQYRQKFACKQSCSLVFGSVNVPQQRELQFICVQPGFKPMHSMFSYKEGLLLGVGLVLPNCCQEGCESSRWKPEVVHATSAEPKVKRVWRRCIIAATVSRGSIQLTCLRNTQYRLPHTRSQDSLYPQDSLNICKLGWNYSFRKMCRKHWIFWIIDWFSHLFTSSILSSMSKPPKISCTTTFRNSWVLPNIDIYYISFTFKICTFDFTEL